MQSRDTSWTTCSTFAKKKKRTRFVMNLHIVLLQNVSNPTSSSARGAKGHYARTLTCSNIFSSHTFMLSTLEMWQENVSLTWPPSLSTSLVRLLLTNYTFEPVQLVEKNDYLLPCFVSLASIDWTNTRVLFSWECSWAQSTTLLSQMHHTTLRKIKYDKIDFFPPLKCTGFEEQSKNPWK